MLTKSDFMFVYDSKLFKFLRYDKGIEFITSGLHEKTKMKWSMFHRTDALDQAIKEFNQMGK